MLLRERMKLTGWFLSHLNAVRRSLEKISVPAARVHFKQQTSTAASINGCGHSMPLLWIIYVEYSTDTSSKDTNLSL